MKTQAMSWIKKLAGVAVLAAAVNASALTITYLPPIHGGNINDVADLDAALGFASGTEMWYKSDGGGTHQSDFTSSVSGTPQSMTFKYVGGSPLPDITYGALKAGNFHIIFSISGWNGEDIVLTQDKILNPPGNAYLGISHGNLYGKPGRTPPPPPSVPDGGATAALLGLGMLGLVAARKVSK